MADDNDFLTTFYTPFGVPAGATATGRSAKCTFQAHKSRIDRARAIAISGERTGDNDGDGDDDNFRVFVRLRPALAGEAGGGKAAALRVGEDGRQVVVMNSGSAGGEASRYSFHGVFGTNSKQGEVYTRAVLPCTEWVLQGYNATVFAYGMTGSGKTYTTIGQPSSASSAGLIPRALADVFDRVAAAREAGITAALRVSFVQLYNNIITDLLDSSGGYSGHPLKLRDAADGTPFVEGLTHVPVASVATALDLLAAGAQRRATGSTNCNEVSSRSHALFSLELAQEYSGGAKRTSVLRIVDLAGSERLKASGATGQRMGETIAINASLLALANVIKALTAEAGGTRRAHVPYRDSKLTQLLRTSLGGNCKTALVATIAPAAHGHGTAFEESLRTLRFACRASYVRNDAHVNEVGGSAGAASARAAAAARAAEAEERARSEFTTAQAAALEARQAELAAAAGSASGFFNGEVQVPTCAGKVAVGAYGASHTGPVVVCLHGYPSCRDTWDFAVEPLVGAGYRVIAIDMPGFGGSSGERLSSRSEHNCAPAGPVAIVVDVLKHFGVRSASLVGYDWGGGIAMSMAYTWPKRVKRVLAFHATYTEQGDELTRVRCPVTLLWAPPDQFHPLAWGRKWAKRIPRATLEVVKLPRTASWRDSEHVDKVVDAIMGQLPTVKKGGKAKGVVAGAGAGALAGGGAGGGAGAGAGAGAAAVSAPATGAAASLFGSKHLTTKEAVAVFRKLWQENRLPACYALYLGKSAGGSGGLSKSDVTRLFASLPVLSPATVQSPQHLVEAGLWASEPPRWAAMDASPRYFAGRRVLWRSPRVFPWCTSDDAYLGLQPRPSKGADRSGYVTYRAMVKAVPCDVDGDFELAVESVVAGVSVDVRVPAAEVYALNQRHDFKKVASRSGSGSDGCTLQFEDSVKCSYHSALTRARCAEIALALEHAGATKLDFGAAMTGDEAARVRLLRGQQKCVSTLRKVLNITRLQVCVWLYVAGVGRGVTALTDLCVLRCAVRMAWIDGERHAARM